MPTPITFYHRYLQTLVQEHVYGERYLRFVYGGLGGRLLLHAIVRRKLFSRTYGWLMSTKWSCRSIQPFIEQYGIDTDEIAEPLESFRSFNEFFHRRLRPSARPIAADDDVIVLPADGRHSAFPDLSLAKPQYVKNCSLELDRFLGSAELAQRYADGAMLISRLAPVDYHRFHFPIDGTAGPTTLIDGSLFSVSPIALEQVTRTFLENKRWVSPLTSERWGLVTMVEVGATNVGSVVHTAGPGHVRRGQEKGYFLFGGSTTVLLFERGRVDFCDDLLEHTQAGREVYAKMGDVAGRRIPTQG